MRTGQHATGGAGGWGPERGGAGVPVEPPSCQEGAAVVAVRARRPSGCSSPPPPQLADAAAQLARRALFRTCTAMW
eukprot:112059-Chlamydomonas_euryale.AAC.2